MRDTDLKTLTKAYVESTAVRHRSGITVRHGPERARVNDHRIFYFYFGRR